MGLITGFNGEAGANPAFLAVLRIYAHITMLNNSVNNFVKKKFFFFIRIRLIKGDCSGIIGMAVNIIGVWSCVLGDL